MNKLFLLGKALTDPTSVISFTYDNAGTVKGHPIETTESVVRLMVHQDDGDPSCVGEEVGYFLSEITDLKAH